MIGPRGAVDAALQSRVDSEGGSNRAFRLQTSPELVMLAPAIQSHQLRPIAMRNILAAAGQNPFPPTETPSAAATA